MAMPLRLIYNANISPKQKAGLVGLFGLCFIMIAFAIIRAKQVLVPQYFVNLTLLMIWSTLAASICEYSISIRLTSASRESTGGNLFSADILLAVIVGSLPALRLFVTNRASAKRSRYGSSAGGSKKPASVQLSSLSSNKKSDNGQFPDAGDSQEDILRSGGSQFILVEHDIVGSTVPPLIITEDGEI